MRQLIKIQMLVEFDSDKLQHVEPGVRQALNVVPPYLALFGMKVVGTEFTRTTPTKDENVRLSPRKKHMDGTTCGAKAPPSRLVKDWAKVTCRTCLKYKPKNQAELFG